MLSFARANAAPGDPRDSASRPGGSPSAPGVDGRGHEPGLSSDRSRRESMLIDGSRPAICRIIALGAGGTRGGFDMLCGSRCSPSSSAMSGVATCRTLCRSSCGRVAGEAPPEPEPDDSVSFQMTRPPG